MKDLIELDTYGYSDHSIELSSDEEEAPGDGVSRPLVHEVQQRKDLALSYDPTPYLEFHPLIKALIDVLGGPAGCDEATPSEHPGRAAAN